MKPATSQYISPAAWEIPTTPTVSFSVPQVIAPYTPTGQTGTTPDSVVPMKPATFQNTSSAACEIPTTAMASLSVPEVTGLPSVSVAESVKPVTFPSVSPSAEIPTIPTSSISFSQVTGAESVEPVTLISFSASTGAESVQPATLISISPLTGLPSVSVAESVKPVTFPSVSPSAEIPTIPTSSISVSQVTGAESVEPTTLISISPSTGLPSVSVAESVEPVTFPSVRPSAEIPTIPTSSISVSQVTGAESVEPATVISIGPSTGAEPVQPATLISISPSTGGAEIVVEQATRSWDVLKSIVYGGLVESIASLGVVSSAAGGDADTLNIIALGLANLIGGLFMIAHNLWELRIERQDRGRTTNQEDKINRYEQTLGNVNNFRLHATVVVLAYIVSGVIPPITYGFSFRKSDNKDYKLIAVAVASLFCTALLAVGKAHIQKVSRSHYLKVVLYYVTLGLSASGLSYAMGHLVKKLLVKLGFVSSAATPTSDFGFLGSGLMTSEWASY